MKRTISILAVLILTGCATVTPEQEPAVPTPTMTLPQAKKHISPQSAVSAPAALVPGDPEDRIEINRNYTHLSWSANTATRAFVLWSPDLTLPVEMWQLPSGAIYIYPLGSSQAHFVFTNHVNQAFFRLVRVPTNTLGVSWSYNFQQNPDTDSFVIRYGNQVGVYDRTNIVDGRRQWTTVEVPDMAMPWYLTATARVSSNNVESAVSDQVVWRPAQ